MKKKFTILITAAVMLLTMMASTGTMLGQTTVTQTSFTNNYGNVNDDTNVTFRCYRGGGTSTPYALTSGVIRLYQINSSNYVGSYVVIGVAEGYKITSATIQSTSATTTGYKLTDTNPNTSTQPGNTTIINNFNVNNYSLSANTDYTINSISTQYITFGCFGTDSDHRLHLSKISITYQADGGPTQLSTPTNFVATPGNTQATFTWDAVDHASSYTISYTPAGGVEQTLANATSPQVISGLTNDTEYTCKIKAVGDGENYSDSDYSSTITVTPTSATYYDITIDAGIEHGSVEASASSATEGTEITLTATADAGYEFGSWNVYKTGDQTTTVTVNNNAFEMPDYNVTVSATFTALPVYTVSCTTPENGTLSVSPTSGYNGIEVTITATPSSGYELATLTATDSEGEITITDNKFNIRNSDVTVAATFTAVIVYEWVPVAIGDLTGSDIFVIVGNNGSNYAMTNDKGTGNPPLASAVTITNGKLTSTVADNMKWNISGNATDGYTFYPNGTTTTWLYCTNTNNGVRVGTNANKTFVINSGYLYHSGTSRHVGIYNSQDWRCYSPSSGNVHANISGQTFTFYKRAIPAAVETPVISLATGTYNTNQSVTITCATDGATIYYTIDGTTPTSSSTEYTEAVSITQTTTLKAIAIKGDDESNVASATYTLKCATPTFSPVAGAYTSVQNVTISSTSPEVSIYYTLDGTTPTNTSILYEGPVSIGETKTLKAIAIKNNWTDSEIATAAYTIELPLTTMDEIYTKAVEYGTTGGNVNISFDNWVITVIQGTNTAYLTDGTKGCIIYQSGHGFNVGDILSGTASCKVKTYYDAPELYNLTFTTTGLVVNTGGTVDPTTTTIAALSAVNTGSVFTLRDLEYDETNGMLSDGINEIKLKDNIYNFSNDVEDGEKYHVTGVFVLYGEQKQIYPRSEEDIVLAADMSNTDFSSLTTFTYIVNNGPSEAQYIGIDGTDFASELTITASGDYEISTSENGPYTSSIVVEEDEGEIAETLFVRLKSDFTTGTHNGTLTFEADNLTTIVVNLEGTVSATQTYDVMINSPIEHGSVVADVSVAEAGATITLTTTPESECYQFVEWVTVPNDLTWTADNQFTMPAEDVLISATFSQITYSIQYAINGTPISELQENVGCGGEASLWDTDEVAILGVELPSGFTLLGWSTTEGGTETVASYEPDVDATLYAVLISSNAVIGYELVTSVSQITEGRYLFAALRAEELPNPIKYSIATGVISSGDIVVTSDKYQPTNNVFETIPTGGVEFELTGNNTDGFVISYDSKTLGYTSNTSRALAFGDYNYLWKFYAKDNGLSKGAVYMQNYRNYAYYTVSENSTTTGALRGYSGQTKYRGFYLFKKADVIPISNVTEISEPEVTMSTNIPENTCVVVEPGTVLTFTGVNEGTAANLVIQDGGQLINTTPVSATIQKNVDSYNNSRADNKGYLFIASPVKDNLDVAAQTNLTYGGNYDLYIFDESKASKEWRNYEATPSDFSTIDNGKGYLYANKANVTIEFSGSIKPSVDTTINLAYNAGNRFAGWNLVGNPFACNAYVKGATGDITAFYKMNGAGDGLTAVTGTIAVEPMEGIFVQATATGQSFKFTRTAPTPDPGKGNLNLQVAKAVNNRDEQPASDNAIIRFDGGNTLEKFCFSDNTAVVYFPLGNKDYAVVNAEICGELPVNFKAVENGTYTIDFSMDNVEFSYLHLIDNMTGNDVNLLLTPRYTFDANISDYASRFRLVFSTNNSNDNDSDSNNNFGFIDANGNLMILGVEGVSTLQVIDVTGRVLSSETFSGNYSKSVNAASGVYMLRLINGNDVKTQKIVIR